ncbi:MoaD/ThiS family protein [Rothia sp. P5766]|uniref:MoaD/ThiS family protein n=1 Tax=Rothia sp. P5766 TaxID=3402656 RepID=UPI003AECB2CA
MQINFFAAARAAAGVPSLTLESTELTETTLEALMAYLLTRYPGATPSGQTLADILPQCTFLIDGVATSAKGSLRGASRVDVLPPFAGG